VHPPPARAQTCGIGEWICHVTADGQHPDGNEQALLWLMNRARQNPSAEGTFLDAIDDPGVLAAIEFYDVDTDQMQDEFDAIAPKPPAAFDRRLWTAARQHADLMIAEDSDDPACGSSGLPPCQLERVGPAGFFFVASGLRGNSFGFATSPLFAHASWNVDWGPFFNPTVPPGMYPGRIHRKGVMSDPDASANQVLTNVGMAVVDTTAHATELGPLVAVANYANANTGVAAHYDRFLVGTVWKDLDADGVYDPGEGKAGVRVTATPASWTATTSPGGEDRNRVAAGPVEVSFESLSVPDFTTSVTVGADSVLVDYLVPEPSRVAASLAAAGAVAAVSRTRTRRSSITRRPSV
jgi:hypothetical protein